MSDFLCQILNHDWFTFAVECVAMASACAACLAAVVLAVRLTAGRWMAPRYRHALWLVVALRLFVPVAPESRFSLHRLWLDALTAYTDSAFVSDQPADQELAAVPAPTFDAPAQPSEPVMPAAVVPGTLDYFGDFWSQEPHDLVKSLAAVVGNLVIVLLVLAWPIGMILTAGWIGLATWRCRRHMRALKGTNDGRLLAVLDSCQKELEVGRRVELVMVSGLGSPAQMGLFRPKILLPDDVARDFSDDELRHILLHELAHVKRWDVAVNMLLSLLQVVYWWNPIFWFVRSRLKTERELACDALVVGAIGAARSTSYGHTLIRIVERLSEAVADSWSPPAAAPGLISFLGRATALKARLRHLPRSTAGNSRKAQVAVWLVMGALVVGGFTDAQTEGFDIPVVETSFNLPAGATWRIGPALKVDNQPLATTVYDCSVVLDRFVREQHLSRDLARKSITDILMPANAGALLDDEQGTARERRRLSLEWQDDRLICRGPQPVVAAIAYVLDTWQQHGLQQICCFIEEIESSIDVVKELGLQGGEIIAPPLPEAPQSPAFAADGIFRRRRTNTTIQVRSATFTERRTPVYMTVLDRASVERLRSLVWRDARANLKMSPRVTLFQGQEASIQVLSQASPFAVGLRAKDYEFYEPQFQTVSEGSQFRLAAVGNAETGHVRLQLGIVDSRIADVAVATVVRGPNEKPLSVQVPSVERRACDVSAELPSGASLLLQPLEERRDRRRNYIVITATILTFSE